MTLNSQQGIENEISSQKLKDIVSNTTVNSNHVLMIASFK